MIALVDEDQGIPGAEAIAARARVGLRSVFRHFGDMDGLYVAVIERIGRSYTHLSRPYEASSWQGQVGEAMARRMEMFETVLPYRRAADMHFTTCQTSMYVATMLWLHWFALQTNISRTLQTLGLRSHFRSVSPTD